MASFSSSTKMNTPLPIWGTTGGENHQFFLCKLPIDKACRLWYNNSGGQRVAHGGGDPIFRSVHPYAKFLILLATFHMRQIFPEKPGGRSVRHMLYLFPRRVDRSPTKNKESPRTIRHMILQRYLFCPYISSCEFLCGGI
jgi:hypothetical protein